MLLIYTHHITPRINYIFDFLLHDILDIAYELTADKHYFLQSSFPKFSYTDTQLTNELFFKSSSILFERGAHTTFADATSILFEKLFATNQASFNGVDIFAASFYLISRMEEYGEVQRDELYRYLPQQSILYKTDLLHRPVVDEWAMDLKTILQSHFPNMVLTQRKYEVQPTIDVDRAFLYKARPLFNQLGASAKELFLFQVSSFSKRMKTIFGNENDPYDVFDELEKLHQQYALKSIYFFHCGNYPHWDKNIELKNSDLKAIILKLKMISKIGLHSSVKSFYESHFYANELHRLSTIAEEKMEINRQHYLLLEFLTYPTTVIKQGTVGDYSMGYPQVNGFRAGTCTPFRFYDFKAEQPTDLWFHPFAIIETPYQFFKAEQQKEMWLHWQQIIDATKKVNGRLCIAFHTQSYSDWGMYKGWKANYEKLLELACS